MDRSRNEILKAKTAVEVHRWIVAHPDQRDDEVCAYFNHLAQEEFQTRIIKQYGRYDPEVHYDFNLKQKP